MRIKSLVKRLFGQSRAHQATFGYVLLTADVENFEYALRRLSAYTNSFPGQEGYTSKAALSLHFEVLSSVVAKFDSVELRFNALQADEATYEMAAPVYRAVAARLEVAAEIFLRAAFHTPRINSSGVTNEARHSISSNLLTDLDDKYDASAIAADLERLYEEEVKLAKVILGRAKNAQTFD